MDDLHRRFRDADAVGAPDLWAEARRRAATPAGSIEPDAYARPYRERGRRAVTIGVAFAVFAAAAAFAWRALAPTDGAGPATPTPTVGPSPAEPERVDLSGLPVGWSQLPTAPPDVRTRAAVGLDDTRLLVWGGYVYSGYSDEQALGDGYVFDLGSGDLLKMTRSPLSPRISSASAWTGTELVVWGGDARTDGQGPTRVDGAAYDPATDRWRSLPDAPMAIASPRSVWSESELLIWSGAEQGPGMAYDPATDAWRTIAAPPLAIGPSDVPIWTGTEAIVFAGVWEYDRQPVGLAYSPQLDTWRRLPPSGIWILDATWDGQQAVAWGSDLHAARYDPTTDTWLDLPDVPVSSCEGGPGGLSAAGRSVLGWFCGEAFVMDRDELVWHNVTPLARISTALPLAYDRSFLMPSYGDTYGPGEPVHLYAYRPPGSFACGGFGDLREAELARVIVDRLSRLRSDRSEAGVRPDLDALTSLPGMVALSRQGISQNTYGHEIHAIDDLGDGRFRVIVSLLLGAGGTVSEELLLRPGENLDGDACALVVDDVAPVQLATRFAPEYTREGDRAYATLTFPDGSRAEVSFPVTLRPFVGGVEPYAGWVSLDDPAPRHPIEFLHGPLEATALLTQGPVLERFPTAGEGEASLIAAREADAWWLAFELEDWTVLVWSPSRDRAAELAPALAVEQDTFGFPVIRTSGGIALRAMGDGDEPELVMSDPGSSGGLLLSPQACSGAPEISQSGHQGSTCLAGEVVLNVSGNRGWVRDVIEGFRLESFVSAE